jgi:hypothetical protein
LDVRNFAVEFTNMIPSDSPAIVPNNAERIFKVSSLMPQEDIPEVQYALCEKIILFKRYSNVQ